MPKIISGLLIIVAIIHPLPVSAVSGSERLSTLYGLSFEGADISILMRHRAIMFGLFGLFFIYAAFKPEFQPLAFIAIFVSVASFIALAWSTGGYNEAIGKVVIVDIVALDCLLVAVILYVIKGRQS